MMVPAGMSLALSVLVCLFAGIPGQGFAPPEGARRDFTVFIVGLDYETNSQISDDTSQMYNDAKAAVSDRERMLNDTIMQVVMTIVWYIHRPNDNGGGDYENQIVKLLEPYGGFIDRVDFKNGSPCVAAVVYWVDVQDGVYRSALEGVSEATLMVWDKPWRLSLEGCNPNLHVLTFNLYLRGKPWMDEMANHSSSVYMQMERLIQSEFSELGGRIRTLELTDNNGCIRAFVDWEADNPGEIFMLTSRAKDRGLMLDNQKMTVSTRPCPPSDADVNQCPPVPPGTSGICIHGCDDNNPEMACDEGYKCCSNGCGKVCVRVGYKVRVTASVVASTILPTSIAPMEGMVEPYINNMVTQYFNNGSASPVVGVEFSFTMDYKTIAGRDYSRMNVNIYLAEDLDNAVLTQGLHMIEGLTLPFDMEQIRIAQAEFLPYSLLEMRSCGGVECHGICKHQITGEDYCSCGAGRMGPACSEFDKEKKKNIVNNNTNNNNDDNDDANDDNDDHHDDDGEYVYDTDDDDDDNNNNNNK
ncbi:chelonianin [Elysia marginata]|uniref:Chelonianin n=1 Tax=Elysia marginata TaxID=1093978 RepID=A0AAV4ICS6_9GAST|nr:chelonianin [Elysia marginata]